MGVGDEEAKDRTMKNCFWHFFCKPKGALNMVDDQCLSAASNNFDKWGK